MAIAISTRTLISHHLQTGVTAATGDPSESAGGEERLSFCSCWFSLCYTASQDIIAPCLVLVPSLVTSPASPSHGHLDARRVLERKEWEHTGCMSGGSYEDCCLWKTF